MAVLMAAGCDDLVEPIAITPDDLRPAIVAALDVTVNEDGSVTMDIEADDPNGEALTLRITTPPQHGTAVLEGSSTKVSAAKRAAEAPSNERQETAESTDDRLARPAAAIHTSVRVLSGTQSLNVSGRAVLVGRIRYTPEADFNGVDRLVFSVRNTSGFASEAEVTLTVGAEPDAPRIGQSLSDLNLAPGQRITLNLRTEQVFSDPDGDILVFSAQSRNAAVATAEVIGDEVLTVQALNAPNQATLIDVTATDPGGLSATASFTVTIEASDNQPPRLENPIADRALTVGETFAVALNTVFADDDGDVLTFNATSGNPAVAQAEIVPPDTLRVTMLTTGVATITVSASDAIATVQTTFSVFLNPGVNAADDLAETDEGVPVVIDVLDNDRDFNNGPLKVEGILRFPANGTAEVIDDDQRVRYTPNPDFFGADSFTYVAGNEQGNLAQATVTVTVREVNKPPEITSLTGDTIGEVGDTLTFSATATDRNAGDVITFSWDFGDGSAVEAGEGLTTVSHVYTFEGVFLLVLTVSDDEGAAHADTLAVTVNPPPMSMTPVATPDRYDIAEGGTLTVDAANGVLANDTDPRNAGLTATLTTNVTNGTLTFNPDGSFTYTHDGSETSTDTFRYRVSDGTDDSNEAIVRFNILEVNDRPSAVDDSYSVDQDSTLAVDASEGVLANDFDPDNDLSELRALLVTGVTNGTLTLNDDGSFTYTPSAGFFGTDTFTYRVNDGTVFSTVATVTIRINQEANEPPEVTTPADQNNLEGETVALQIQAADPDTPFQYSSATLPPGLSIDAGTGLISGTLPLDAAGPTGTTTFAVTVFVLDARGGQSSASFDWTITNPDPMVTSPGNQANDEGDTIFLQIQATDDDTLTYAASGLPSGLMMDTNTGEITGAIDAGASTGSPYTVDVTVTDPQTGSAMAQFQWTVTATNTPPSVTNPGHQIDDEGDTISLQIMATDPDVPLSYAATGLPSGLSIDANTGEITGTIDADAASPMDTVTVMVEVTVTDNLGAADSVQFDWTITNPHPSVTNPGNQSDTAGDVISLQIQATDDDALAYAASGLPSSLSINTDTGEISGTIDLNAASATPYTVDVTVTDPQTGSTMVQFDWSVDNPAPTLNSISPTSGAQNQALNVTLTGSNFIDGVSSVSFSGSGITINSTTVNSDTEIVVNISIDAAAATGARDVTVTNTGPGGGTSGAQTFTVTT